MSVPQYILLPEGTLLTDFVINPLFTDVTKDGEKYTTYRIVRITHEILNHPDDWTHLANVSLEYAIGIGVAYLRLRDGIVEESRIKPPTSESI